MFGDYAKILEPTSLKERVIQLLKKNQEMLQG
jgi:predicted DNA-binding transcriptional regulator YafY